jgi:hypothetical protein
MYYGLYIWAGYGMTGTETEKQQFCLGVKKGTAGL